MEKLNMEKLNIEWTKGIWTITVPATMEIVPKQILPSAVWSSVLLRKFTIFNSRTFFAKGKFMHQGATFYIGSYISEGKIDMLVEETTGMGCGVKGKSDVEKSFFEGIQRGSTHSHSTAMQYYIQRMQEIMGMSVNITLMSLI